MNTSIVTFEQGKNGLITKGQATEGNNIAGYYVHSYISGRFVSTKGTPSSNGKKRFAKIPTKFLV